MSSADAEGSADWTATVGRRQGDEFPECHMLKRREVAKNKIQNHRTKERERKRSSLADQLTPEQHHLISALAVRCVLRAAREARLISESQEMGEKHNSCTKYQLLPQYCLTTAAIFPAKSLEPHPYHKFETFVST